MPASYLHGVEVLQVTKGVIPFQQVNSAVIGLVGLAPKQAANTLFQVITPADAAAFGSELPGFTIPQALTAIFSQTRTVVFVVNVFDPLVHTAQVTQESQTLVGGKLKLAYAPIGDVTVLTSAGAATGFVLGTDYRIDDFGNFQALSALPVNNTTYKFTYKRLDATTVSNSDLIGSENGSVRKGMKAFKTAFNQFGFKPRILIAPGYSQVAAIASALDTEADYYRGVSIKSLDFSTTNVSQAITARGPGLGAFSTSSKRAMLAYPGVKSANADPSVGVNDTNAQLPRFLDAFLAGLRAKVDIEEGYWVSMSNHVISGVTGSTTPITWDLTDQTGTTEANLLNAAGISTLAIGFGTGVRFWGNSNASFPTNANADRFVAVSRTRDIVEDSVAYNALPFADQPLTRAQIDSIVDSVNAFLRTLIGRGALLEGSVCVFDPTQNSVASLAAGQANFSFNLMSPTPGERLTFNSFLDTSLLLQSLNPTT